jgi:ubiquinone biosynthesis protein
MHLLRFAKILQVAFRYGLDEFIPALGGTSFFHRLLGPLLRRRAFTQARAVRLRLALEGLGPIFVKFGQLLSVRPDLLPPDIVEEMSKLQDQVPPFAPDQVVAALNDAYGQPYQNIFSEFDLQPVASASIAQVHFAVIGSGKEAGRQAAVKIVRPDIARVIAEDVGVLRAFAWLTERLLPDGKRLRPRAVVAEFEKTIIDELDMLREAANASQLRRNFAGGRLLYVPEVFWDYCQPRVLTMERIDAIPVNALADLKQHGVDIKRLSREGVEIFFTQVFRDAFFHADMHPGNIFVLRDGRYTGVDFGIMGTLSERDKQYLATNMMAFFNRDYKRVAQAHIEAGWVPRDTREDEFESAIRSVCEPVFGKPLKEIYFGRVLLRLFEVSRRFKMEVQPQLVLLQKTLLQIEGLGRQLDPDLDLVVIAKPILKRWVSEQIGLRGLARQLREEVPHWGTLLPQLPRLAHTYLSKSSGPDLTAELHALRAQLEKTRRWIKFLSYALGALVLLVVMGYWSGGRG